MDLKYWNQYDESQIIVPMDSLRWGIEWCDLICDQAGLELSQDAADRVIDYDETHQQYRHGKPSYDRERYGL